jgi:hypothetical protein
MEDLGGISPIERSPLEGNLIVKGRKVKSLTEKGVKKRSLTDQGDTERSLTMRSLGIATMKQR